MATTPTTTQSEALAARQAVRFRSGDADCAAWYYPSANGACVLMAAGFAVTKEPGTDPFAVALADAGFGVLAFDYRRLGDSGGQPRQLIRLRDQLDDWDAAIEFARGLPGVDPARIGIWGFSASAGHVFVVASRHPELGAAVSQGPLADGVSAALSARKEMPLSAMAKLHLAAASSLVRTSLLRRDPVLVPLTGPRGAVASITTADARNGPPALDPDGVYGDTWRQEVAATSALRLAYYRPARLAPRIQVPLLVMAYESDGVAPPAPAVKAAKRAPKGELALLPGGHYEGYMGGWDAAVGTMLEFYGKHLVPRNS